MSNRDQLAQDFALRAGWGDAMAGPLAGDASNRRYLRLRRDNGDAAVLMDAPPDKGEDIRPFIHITTLLRKVGLSAPAILAQDDRHGFLLLEDLGDDLFARVLHKNPRT